MSDPSGFALSNIRDEGTQRMVEDGSGVDLGCPRDKETSSSGFESISSRVDVVGVITWLKPVGEAHFLK